MTDKLKPEIAKAKSQLESGDYDVIEDVEAHQTPKDKLKIVKEALEANILDLEQSNPKDLLNLTQQALTELNSYIEARDSEEMVERVAKAIYETSPTGGTYLNTWGGLCDMATRKHSGYFAFANHLKHKAEAEAKAAIKAMEGNEND